MRAINSKASLIRSGLAAAVLLLTAGASFAQSVTLNAVATQAVLPDGQSVPMWGYTCGASSGTGVSCVVANANAGLNWSPVVITVPAGPLDIALNNSLPVPTSLVIVGQLGGGLGDARTTTPSPLHAEQGPTWPASGGPTGINCADPGAAVAAAAAGSNCPPAQGPRVQSFATEVAAGTVAAPASATLNWANLRPGTYLIESGTHPSIQGPMGLYGVLIVTEYPGVTYDVALPVLLSEIDPLQNRAVDAAVRTLGFAETKVWSGLPGRCGNPLNADGTANAATLTNDGYQSCYPPAVNYDPRYFLVNGASFDRTNIRGAITGIDPALKVPMGGATGSVLLRFVNAGLRMHVPSVVGLNMTLLAEDGNILPGVPKVQSEVFLAAGKTYDVTIHPTQSTAGIYDAATYPVFDRQLSLSTNNNRDGGMQVYIDANGGAATGVGSGDSGTTLAAAAAKTYFCVNGTTLSVTDPTFGVLGGSSGANGAALVLDTTTLLPVGVPAGATLTFNSNGTFSYSPPPAPTSCGGSFSYLVNGTKAGIATITECDFANSFAGGCVNAGAPVANADAYTSNAATQLHVGAPGVLLNDTDPGNRPLTVDIPTAGIAATDGTASGCAVAVNADGSFSASAATPGTCSFTYSARNSQGATSAAVAATLTFPTASGLSIAVLDAKTRQAINDYRWIIEEDKTFWIDPKCQINSTTPGVRPSSCAPLPVQSLGYNFHTSNMPVLATGCVGKVSCEAGQTQQGAAVACDVGDGVCRAAAQKNELLPSQVALDPNKRYYISILPGDGINPVASGAGGAVDDASLPAGQRPFSIGKECGTYSASDVHWVPGGPDGGYPDGTYGCGHAMGGAQLAPGQLAANVVLQQTPLPTAKITVFVFEDDTPLNGENDAGGGVNVLAPNEPGLGGFEVKLFDQAGGLGDATGQITYDMFNQPVSNALAGMKDAISGFDACAISTTSTDGLVGMIPTCPTYEYDSANGKVAVDNTGNECSPIPAAVDPACNANWGKPFLSPLAGQALIANLYPGLYEVVATPAADRIARGEEWLQTNTLDGGKPHEAFIKPDEPGYFQEFGPGGFHVAIGFANPQIINDRKHNSIAWTHQFAPSLNLPDAHGTGTGICDPLDPTDVNKGRDPTTLVRYGGGGMSCTSSLTGTVSNAHMSRTPDQRIMSSGSYDAYSFTQCYIGLGAPDEADFGFAKCETDPTTGAVTFNFTNIPDGNFKLTVFDQWNDLMLDGLVSPVTVGGVTTKDFPVTQWRTNIYTRTYMDTNGDGVSQESEPGLPLVATNIRYRDGSYGFFNNTDLNGYAGFNEVFPFMSWLVIEADTTRFKPTGMHSVNDTGGPVDGAGGGNSAIAAGFANTLEPNPLPANLRVPGAVYCADADCSTDSIANGPYYTSGGSSGTATPSSGRIDPPWATSEGWQGLLGQNNFLEFGMKKFMTGENGGIKGHVIYASTRPFDDPALSLQLSWEPGVPRVQINLYQESTAADGTKTLKLVDTTRTSSWDDWAQGFRTDGIPNMNCPGQDATSPFFATLQGSTQWLDPNVPKTALPNDAQFKCYDGWSMLNQVQPAPYDGMYKFPSIVARDPTSGRPFNPGGVQPAGTGVAGALPGTNCTICTASPDTSDPTPMLPAGKYVVEVIVPPGFELVKEEDKNILLGDTYVAPVTQQFAGFGNVFIMPDQAAVNASYNANNPGALNLTNNLGATPRHEGDTGSVESFWPCVGTLRVVPDFNSLFPTSGQNAPFAGANRALCDRKEVTLEDQMSALAKFYIFTPTHVAGHFTGAMTNDFASEFDPFSPQFGEKFGPPNLPVSMRDFTGNEMGRVYSDQWGLYNGLNYSSYAVNPPNPTGYIPTMMIACMNDPGPIPDPANPTQLITDPAYNPAYSNFCYETPFMPGFTAYMDTPVIPTQAFADGYNLPDAEYPNLTPAISMVTGDANGGGAGPWVSQGGHSLTITALGDKVVQNPDYSGPNAAAEPYNLKAITRHYGFGASQGTVTIGGVNARVTGWSDTSITVAVPANTVLDPGQVPSCPLQQRGNGNGGARCGELVITAADGHKSIDAITVTVGGKAPTYINGENAAGNALQAAIDAATPGDLIVVGPGVYKENVLMWKPVRLQGVGAVSVTINADAHPAGKMDGWRRQVNCLFGLTLEGVPNPGNAAFDSTGAYSCPNSMFLRVDRLPFEGFVGWDATSNGNLAQVLQEPTLMGAYEGAGITVLGRGVRIPGGSQDFWGQATGAGTFPDGSNYLTSTNQNCNSGDLIRVDGHDYGTSNFLCNPSRIDGISVINSSQGGGAIMAHGWNHGLEIANTRISANHGTLTGGISVGYGEVPAQFINDGTCGTESVCPPVGNTPTNGQIPFGFNRNVHVHHNSIIDNASIGDALFSGTPSGAGAITISAGSDNYQVDHNWIAGNLSTGDGGGMVHAGFSANGNISNNWIVFNQSVNPTLPTNGGGLAIVGSNNDRTLSNGLECGTFVDVTDCPPGIGDGTGPGLVIDGNLIMGNSAESGSGGGLRLQQINGSEVGNFLNSPNQWYGVSVTNNVIANNVAGWDGAGVSLEDALKVSFVNNTVVSNDTTASAGVLFKTLGAVSANAPPPGCDPNPLPGEPQPPGCTDNNAAHRDQPAGLVTMINTPNLRATMPINNGVFAGLCPGGFPYGAGNSSCALVSMPKIANDMFWQNRAFHVDITGPGSGLISQQNLVALFPTLNQDATGACMSGATYWDIGVRGDSAVDSAVIDTVVTGGSGGTNPTLVLSNSILTDLVVGRYDGQVAPFANVAPGADPVIAKYCNGSRVPPENGGLGYNAPAGRSETTGLSPVFTFNNITPAATVDEGTNWINLGYGPLTLFSAPGQAMLAAAAAGTASGAYSITSASAANNAADGSVAPNHDFFGNPRPQGGGFEIGAVEVACPACPAPSMVIAPNPVAFGAVSINTNKSLVVTVSNTGNAPLYLVAPTITAGANGNSQPARYAVTANTCPIGGAGVAAAGQCLITVRFAPTNASVTLQTATLNVVAVNAAAQAVGLNGRGVVPMYTIAPAAGHGFGNQQVGLASAAFRFTVTNTAASLGGELWLNGQPNVTGTSANQFQAAFRAGDTCAANTHLAMNASCTFSVTFAPTSTGAKGTAAAPAARVDVRRAAGAVRVTNPAPPVWGTGVAPAAAAAASFTWPNGGTVGAWGANTGQRIITVTNTGVAGSQLSFTALQAVTNLTGGAQFSRTGGTCAANTVLARNANCTVNVTRARPAVAPFPGTGRLTLSDTGGATASQVLNLTGN